MKNKPILKITIFALIFAMTAAAVISCAPQGSEPGESEPAAGGSTEAETDELDARQSVSDGLPEADFEGGEFRTVCQDSCKYDMWVEAQTGDALNDAIYIRNRTVEERFNLVIKETEYISYSQIMPKVRNFVNAGDDAYDLILGQMEDTGAAVTEGLFLNWYDVEHVDFSKPWYPKSLIENAATVNGQMYSTMSDLCISYAEQTWAIVYDKVKAESYNLGEIYPMVNGGTWTYDKLISMCKDVYTDLNGDGKSDQNDFHGLSFGLNGCMLLAWFYGFDQRLVTVGENHEIETPLNGEKAADIAGAFKTLITDYPGVYNNSDSSNAGIYKKFVEGTALFCPIEVQYIYSQLRDYQNDYGIVPFPKWEESQSEYYSVCDAGCNVMALPVTATRLDLIGTAVEALSAYSWKTVLPTYYDIALDVKSTRDEESVAMLDMILENRIIDFAYLYDGWKGWVFALPDLIKSQKGFASAYATNEKTKTAYYQKVLDFFME